MKLNTWKNHFESRRSGLIIAFSLIFCATRIASAQSWTQLAPAGGPPAARYQPTGVYDPASDQMIIFGGNSRAGTLFSDVWSVGLGANPHWTQISPAGTTPAARAGHTAVYDSTNARMMVFGGGLGFTSPCVNDVWVLSNANGASGTPTWTQLNPVGSPPSPRNSHSAVYDPTSNRMMMVFGGDNCFATFNNEVWVLSNANGLGGTPTWTQLAPAGTPPDPSETQSAVYDPASNRLILFGVESAGGHSNQVWVLTNANGMGGTPTWILLAPTGTLGPVKAGQTTAYNSATNQMIVFGGGDTSDQNDTWVLSRANGLGGSPQWTQIQPVGALPAPRSGFPSGYDPATNRLAIFGGYTETIPAPNVVNDTWVISVPFFYDFEGSSLRPWWTVTGPGSATLVNTPVHNGNQSLQLADSPTYPWSVNVEHDFGAEMTGSVSVWVLGSQLCCGTAEGLQINNAAGNNSASIQIGNSGCNTCFQARFVNNGTEAPSVQFSDDPNVWHLFEIDTGASGTTFKVDGTVVRTSPGITFRYLYLSTWSGPGGAANADDFTAIVTPATAGSPTDTTPPVITPNVSGTVGANGWYRSVVTVNWTVTDPESGISSSTGCGTVTLNSDTTGTTLTCSATNGAGLSNSVPVTVQVDMTPPAVLVTGVSNGATYLLGAVPAAGCTTADATSGVAVNAGVNVSGGGPNGLGTFTATCSGGQDKAGNMAASVSATYTVQVPPAGMIQVTGTGTWGSDAPVSTWTAPNATWQFSFTVAESPAVVGPGGGTFGVSAFNNFVYSLNGVQVSTTPNHLEFYNSANGGGVLLDDFDNLSNGLYLVPGTPLYTGSDTNPTLVTGTFSPANASFTPAGGGRYFASASSLTLATPSAPSTDLLVSTMPNDNTPNQGGIQRFDGSTGASKGYFVAPGTGGLNTPVFFVFGPDGNVYVSDANSNRIKRFNGSTGAFIDDFVTFGADVSAPNGLAFGPDGMLYVGCTLSAGGGEIRRYHLLTGTYLNTFVPSGSGGLSGPQGMVFGPDGNLYVLDGNAIAVLRYNGTTGAAMGTFVSLGSGTPISLTFSPDHNLWVGLFYGQEIKRFDGTTGADLGTNISVSWPCGLAFGANGNLYASERYVNLGGDVEQYNGTTGASLGAFALPSGVQTILDLKWFPNPYTDSTPPVIIPTITGTTGPNGWYTSAVSVNWTVLDAESGIATSTGCGTANLTTNTTDTTLTCSATNGAGLSNSAMVTVKIDQTAPSITPTITGTLGNNGWYTSAISVAWAATDPESGVASSSGCTTTNLTSDTAGVTLTCSATNGAGLSNSVPVTVAIDTTPPTVTVTGVANGAVYTLGAVPMAGCNTVDGLSGVAVQASPTISGGQPSRLGNFTATCSGGQDNAGNTAAPAMANYRVQAPPAAQKAHLYVASAISPPTLSVASINNNTGVLTPIAGSPFVGGGATQSGSFAAIDPSGRFLYFALSAGFTTNNIGAFAINAATGGLSPIPGSPFSAGIDTIGVTVDPTGRFVYLADPNSSKVAAMAIDPTTGALTVVPGSPFEAGATGFEAATVEPSGRFVYFASNGAASGPTYGQGPIAAFSIDQTFGALTPLPGSPFAAGVNLSAISADPSGQFLYAADSGNGGSGQILGFAINQTTGLISALPGSPWSTSSPVGTMTINPTGHFAYAANNYGGQNLYAYSLDPATGALTALTGSPYAVGFTGTSVAVDPSGKFLYASSISNGTVTPFSINQTTGVPTVVSGSPLSATNAYGMVTTSPVSLNPTTRNFGSQGLFSPTAPKTVTINNHQSVPLNLGGSTIGGSNSGDFAQTSTTCGATLAPQSSCTISFQFTPTALGVRTASLNVNDDADNSPQIAVLTGTGIQPVTVTPATLGFSSQGIGSPTAAKKATVNNNTNGMIAIGGIAISGTNATDFVQVATTCGATLAAQASCTISVQFTPSGLGARSAILSVTDAASNSPQTVNLTGTGVQPVTATPATLGFGGQGLGSPTASKTVTVSSNINSTVTFSSITITGANAGDFQQTGTTCGATLAAQANCTISIQFTPTATGARAAALTIADDASNSPQTVNLTGSGVQPVTATPATLGFGSQGLGSPTTSKTVTVNSNINSTVTFASITITGANAGDFQQTGTTCGSTLGAQASCTISIQFTPAGTGSRTATLTIADNASNSPQTVNLTGSGVQPVTATPGTLSFGSQTVGSPTASKTVTVTSNVNATVTFAGITITGTNAGDFQQTGTTCGGTLAAQANCTISIQFTPAATGARTAMLTITDDTTNSPQTVTLNGTGH